MIAIWIARISLAVFFATAGIAKLTHRKNLVETVEGFGVSKVFAAPIAVVLPWVELAIAVSVVLQPTARLAAVAAMILLIAFAVAIALALHAGKQLKCNCFGQISDSLVGYSTFWRNIFIACVAGGLALTERTESTTGLELLLQGHFMTAVLGVVIALLLAFSIWAAISLFGQQGRMLVSIDRLERRLNAVGIPDAPIGEDTSTGLAIGSVAPSFSLPSVDGGVLSLNAIRARKLYTILVFSDPKCSPCVALLPRLGELLRRESSSLNVAVVSRGSAEENLEKARASGLSDFGMQSDREVAQSFQVTATPSGVLVDRNGLIASPVAVGSSAILSLADRVPNLPTENARLISAHEQLV